MGKHLTSIAYDEEYHEHPDCGCRLVRDDADGRVSYYQCATHAAAPDLLEACKAIVAYYQNMSGNPGYPVADKYWIEGAIMARAAIAKAGGGA